jgi:hypothetical protein
MAMYRARPAVATQVWIVQDLDSNYYWVAAKRTFQSPEEAEATMKTKEEVQLVQQNAVIASRRLTSEPGPTLSSARGA